jgi:ketosteroid isomerase-like protein
MSQESIEIIRRLFAARTAQDIDAAVSCLAEDAELDASRRVLDPMVLRGHDGYRRFIAALDEVWAQQTAEPEDFIEVGDQYVVPVRLTSVGQSGATVTARAAWVVTVQHGKVTRACVYQSIDEALEAVGLSA